MTSTLQPPRRATIYSVNKYLDAMGEIVCIYYDSFNDGKISGYRISDDGLNYEFRHTPFRTAREFLDGYLAHARKVSE